MRLLAMAATTILAAVSMSWSSAVNSPADGEFILTAATRAEDGSGPPIDPTGDRTLMGRMLSPMEARMSATTTAKAAAQPVRPGEFASNQPSQVGYGAFAMGSTFTGSHIRALGRVVISLNPSHDSTRFTNDPHTRDAVAEGIARLAEAPLQAITTSFTPTTSNTGTFAEQDRGLHIRGSVTADFTVTFQAEPSAQEDSQAVFSLMHFPKAALFAQRIQNNNTTNILRTIIVAAIAIKSSETPGVKPYVLEVLKLSLLLFEELSVKQLPGIASAEPVPSTSHDFGSSWLRMGLVATGATIMFVLALICFGALLWWWLRRFSGWQKPSVRCVSAAYAPPQKGKIQPKWLQHSAAQDKLSFTAPVALRCETPTPPAEQTGWWSWQLPFKMTKQHKNKQTEKATAVASVVDKRHPRFVKRQQVLVYSGSQGGWVQGSVHAILVDGSVLVRYSKGTRSFEKKVPYSRIDTSIRRPYLRKQKVKFFSTELNVWLPGTIEVVHTDDSLVVLYEKDGMQCRSLVPQILVESRIRRVNAGRSSIW